jgi:hypothetical protein
MGKRHLVNIAQPLIPGMRNYLQYQRVINGNKSIYRVVDDFADSGHCCCFVKGLTANVQRQDLKSYF